MPRKLFISNELEFRARLLNTKDIRLQELYSMPPNLQPFLRLYDFYDDITCAIGNKIEWDNKENILICLSLLLYDRQLTRNAYLEYVNHLNNSIILDDQNSLSDFSELNKCVEALHREAAALYVLINKIKIGLK